MNIFFLKRENSKSLTLFFAGWAMNESILKDVYTEDDLAICFDYTDLSFDYNSIEEYTDIHIIAWSMGVWASQKIYKNISNGRNITMTAVNGTTTPIDNKRGIPEDIFNGTIEGLTERTREKFLLRMCGDVKRYEELKSRYMPKPIEESKNELIQIKKMCEKEDSDVQKIIWDRAYIGTKDRIFTKQNQERAWEGYAREIFLTNSEHYDKELFERIIAKR